MADFNDYLFKTAEYEGMTVGAYVLARASRMSAISAHAELNAIGRSLPPPIQSNIPAWIDDWASAGRRLEFWRLDCAGVMRTIMRKAHQFMGERGATTTIDEELSLSQIIMLSFVHTACSHAASKATIEEAAGTSTSRSPKALMVMLAIVSLVTLVALLWAF